MSKQLRTTTIGRFTVVCYDQETKLWTDFYSGNLTDSVFWYFSGRGKAYYIPAGSAMPTFPLPPPSETLLSLLRSFHEHKAIMPLLDRFFEEYPELEPHLSPYLSPSFRPLWRW